MHYLIYPIWTTFQGSRDNFVYVPSQWETTLQCNFISHWLDTYTVWICWCWYKQRHSLVLKYFQQLINTHFHLQRIDSKNCASPETFYVVYVFIMISTYTRFILDLKINIGKVASIFPHNIIHSAGVFVKKSNISKHRSYHTYLYYLSMNPTH